MERELHNIRIVSLIILIFIGNPIFASATENEYHRMIIKYAEAGEKEKLVRTAKEFFRQYPKSNLVADVRLILAENEQDPGEALIQYKILIDKYRYFKQRDYVQYKICEILYLQSKWNDLIKESRKGITDFKDSAYLIKYKFLLAKAYIHQEEFEKAKEICMDITESDHSYNTLSDSLILLSYINKNIFGLSGSYLYSLSEIISGFSDSPNMPAALFLLGQYYESKEEYNKAYSVFSDLIQNFPKSPEAESSRKELVKLIQFNPVKTAYLPDRDSMRNTDQIDIQPEIDLDDNNKNEEPVIQYSISLGPFNTINDAREIKVLINEDFQPVEIVQLRKGYRILAGRFSKVDSAVNTRIRLAEEFGINGNIVKIIKDSDKIYVYDE